MTDIAYRLLAVIARLICLTLRVRRVQAGPVDALARAGTPHVIAFWHGAMIAGWFFHRPTKKRGRVSALVSLSKDGSILASVLEAWGFRLVRGSSHIGGKEALSMMTREILAGSTLCVTPDGPRGPRHVMKAGAVLAARRAGVPLVIAGLAVKHKKVLTRSWDRFEIPMPFSEVCIWYDDPIIVPPMEPSSGGPSDETKARAGELDRASMTAFIATVESRLNQAHRNAHERLGIDIM
ncbi:MAG TPA: lysophospholipid acyltransferase family protein [Bacteroidota bacterium]|nr:lysophospholipid acyltransferase family protein [Bacteroidota bacterium]